MISRPPVGDILALILPGHDAASRDRARAALETLEASGAPWYLRLLTGIAAWAGGGFMLSFITAIVAAMLGGNNFEGLAIMLGWLIATGAVLLRRSVTDARAGVGAQFLRQLALVGCFCGQMLFIGGVGSTTRSTPAAASAALIASVILIAVYPDRVQRFCSTLIIAGALLVLGHDGKFAYTSEALAILLAAATLFVGRVVLRGAADNDDDGWTEIAEPVMYGCAIALFGLLMMSTAIAIFGAWEFNLKGVRALMVGMPTAFFLVLALLWLTASIFGEHGEQPTSQEALLSFASIIAIGWITQTTPAITATMMMLALGFDRRARALIVLSAVFFLMFGTAYYYGLNLTLLQKSGILAASGVFCLMASAYVRYRYREHEEYRVREENA